MQEIEIGNFFCENCGYTHFKRTYEDKVKEDCKICGFDVWIFEPLHENKEEI